ncbi:MAG: alpha/beta fold hydrolase [Actinomycetota bacterium]
MRAKIDGLELEYDVRGSGPDLVWLHGLGGNLEDSRPVAESLAKHFRVLSYSTRGCGHSTPLLDPTRYGYDRIAADLDEMIDVAGFTSPLLVGGSHGANTILRHTAEFPGRSRAIMLIAPGANALEKPGAIKFFLAIRTPLWLARRKGPDGIVRLFAGADPKSPKADPHMVASARTHDPASIMVAVRNIPNQRAVDPVALPKFDLPTHVVAWDKDPLIHPIAVARRIAAEIPGATFQEIQKMPDMPPTQVAGIATEVVCEWADGVLGSRSNA